MNIIIEVIPNLKYVPILKFIFAIAYFDSAVPEPNEAAAIIENNEAMNTLSPKSNIGLLKPNVTK